MCKHSTTGGFLASALRYGTRAFLAVLVISLLSTVAFAQVSTGSISGTVADKDGAVIPGATVIITDMGSKTMRRTVSDNAGSFTVPGLQPGNYAIRVEAKGFKAWETKGIDILPGDKKSVNQIAMQIGASDVTVNVEASALAISITDTGDRASVLTSNDIKNLAIMGRDVSELVKTLPGFSNTTGGAYGKSMSNTSGSDPSLTQIGNGGVGNGYSGNGTPFRGGGSMITSDGASVVDPGCNCASTQTVNADMVAEVKVSTSTFSADNALGPVVIQAVSKSGSSQFNGGLYFHFRNGTLNSNTYTNKKVGLGRPSTHYDYVGGQLGGPVKIPFLSKFNKDNKMFFFAGYEYYHQTYISSSDGGTVEDFLPTDAEWNGDLSPTSTATTATSSITNTQACAAIGASSNSWANGNYTCAAFTTIVNPTYGGPAITVTNQNISAYLGAGAMAYKQLTPHANFIPTGGQLYDYVAPVIGYDNGWMFHGKVDYNFSDSTKLSVNYNQQRDMSNVPIMLWWNPGNEIPYPADMWTIVQSKTIAGNFVKVVNPTLTNEFTATLAYLNIPYSDQAASKMYKTNLNFPFSGVQGISKLVPGTQNQWWANYFQMPTLYQADIADGANAYYSKKVTPSFADTITKVRGNHTLKAGIFWTRVQNAQVNFNQAGGAAGITWYGPGANATNTNDVLASYLLDYAVNYSETANNVDDIAYQSLGLFFQDDWKFSKKLTFNLGLRVSHDPSWYDHGGTVGISTWDPADYREDISRGLTAGPGVRYHGMDSSVPLTGRDVKPFFYAPRLGMAWDVLGNGKTVVRGGFGLYYYHDQFNFYQGPDGNAEAAITCSIWNSGYLSWYQSNPGGNFNSSCGSSLSPNVITTKNGAVSTTRNVESVSVIDRYDKSQPSTLTYNMQIDQQTPFNTVLEVAYSGNQSFNQVSPWLNLNAIPLKSFFSPDPLTGVSFANNIKNIEGDGNNTGSYRNDYRPYINFNTLDVLRHGGWGNYNSLQASLIRSRGSFNFNLNYTFSKMLGTDNSNTDAQPDPINIHNLYGVVPQDRSQVLNGTFSYEVGKFFKSNKALDFALDGWMISNITQIQSGPNLQAAYGSGRNFGVTGGLNSASQSAVTAAGGVYQTFDANSSALLGSSDYTLMPVLTCNPTSGLGSHQYFNASCFAVPTIRGVNGRYQWPYIHGTPYWSSDIALQKTFKITERQNVQFRISAFNFLNHPLNSFDPNNMAPVNLNYTGTWNAATNTAAYTLNAPAASAPYGVSNTKEGQRTLELTLRYNF